MAEKTQRITIDTIFGGESDFSVFSGDSQFNSSYAINPDQPISDSGGNSYRPSGLIRPVSSQACDSATINGAPFHFIPNPKDGNVYVYDSVGSVYTLDPSNYTVTGLSDLNDAGSASGNGGEYYDNYVYLARDTTIARYGPLNGTPAFTDDYWVTTLSKTAMENTTYPTHANSNHPYPNHPLHQHSDGRVYIGDVLDNAGVIHYIATTKTTVEGDTDNSSTYDALDLPYGFWPMDIESYGEDIAVALYEGSNATSVKQRRARLIFWDTTASSPTKVIQVEFPDPIITALQNVNGVLYTFSGNLGAPGTRVCRFIGGYTFEEIAFIADSVPPFPGATDAVLNKILFAGTARQVNDDTSLACAWGYGSKTNKFTGLFNVMGATNSSSSAEVTALKVVDQDDGFAFEVPILGTSDGTNFAIDRQSNDYGRINQIFRSELFRLGAPFKIKKIRIPLAQAMAANMEFVPKLIFDEGTDSKTLVTVDNTGFSGKQNIVIRPENAQGDHSFLLELKFSGSVLCTVNLPITIEYEITPDD